MSVSWIKTGPLGDVTDETEVRKEFGKVNPE